ncbi:MAG: response regulator [Clostridia bacterium]|nr:response regulator [Clostridia bacterium]
MSLLGVSVSKHLLDEHYTVIWANDFYYQLIGWTKEEYETRFHNHCDLYYKTDPEEWNLLVNTVTKALETKQEGYQLVSPIRRKNGERIWVKFSTAFADEYVNGYQVAYSVLTNIDDFVRMQKEQSVTYDNLPGFVAKFRVENGGFEFLEANGRFRDFFGSDGQECLPYGLTNYDTEKNRATFRQNLPLMEKGEPVHFTLQSKDPSGKDMWMQVNAECIDWVDQSPIYLVIYIDITDITEQRELQKQLEERSKLLNEALQAAEKANKSKSDFLSRMSHDIRTPMNAIMGMTAIASSHIDDKERIQDCLSKIEVSSKLLLSLINEVLDMSKIESGRITMADEEFSLSDILQSMITIIHPSVLEKQHTFDIHAYQLKHENVIGDPQRIEQVFLNILSNAIKYTPHKGKIVLDIKEKPSNRDGYGYYEFIFKDNGYGMTPEFVKKIFLPFERAEDDNIHTIQGTGLGMAISQNIVRMMGGDIQVSSSYGQGSVFTVTMYLKLQEEKEFDLKIKAVAPVLVVDDDQISCETTCQRLEELGLDSQWALSGEEAIKMAASAHQESLDYQAIIIDLKMPGMDGIETARQIRKRIGKHIPIILLSAYDWTEYEASAKAAGVDGFVVKPMLRSSLAYALKRYVLKETKEPVDQSRSKLRKGIHTGKRLLLVEDNDLNREIAVEILQRTGALVDIARNGQEAVDMFQAALEDTYSLIFMDIQMPVMGGIEATRIIRNLKRADAKKVPIIAMTANVFTEDIAESKAAGMNEHLAKPLDLEQIYQIMEQYLCDVGQQSKE